jgi:plasmid stabilization system protein ParE
MNIVWLPFASNDLASIADYHDAAASADVAKRLIQHIVRSAAALAENPRLGKPSESADGIHEFHIPRVPYLLPYRVVEDRIEILRVFHEAQDRPSTWQS